LEASPISLDQVSEAEIRVTLDDLLDFAQRGIETVIADLDQGFDQHRLGFDLRVFRAGRDRFKRRLPVAHCRDIAGEKNERNGD